MSHLEDRLTEEVRNHMDAQASMVDEGSLFSGDLRETAIVGWGGEMSLTPEDKIRVTENLTRFALGMLNVNVISKSKGDLKILRSELVLKPTFKQAVKLVKGVLFCGENITKELNASMDEFSFKEAILNHPDMPCSYEQAQLIDFISLEEEVGSSILREAAVTLTDARNKYLQSVARLRAYGKAGDRFSGKAEDRFTKGFSQMFGLDQRTIEPFLKSEEVSLALMNQEAAILAVMEKTGKTIEKNGSPRKKGETFPGLTLRKITHMLMTLKDGDIKRARNLYARLVKQSGISSDVFNGLFQIEEESKRALRPVIKVEAKKALKPLSPESYNFLSEAKRLTGLAKYLAKKGDKKGAKSAKDNALMNKARALLPEGNDARRELDKSTISAEMCVLQEVIAWEPSDGIRIKTSHIESGVNEVRVPFKSGIKLLLGVFYTANEDPWNVDDNSLCVVDKLDSKLVDALVEYV